MDFFKEFVGGIVALLCMFALFVVYLYLGVVIEADIRCENGATEYCFTTNSRVEE